MIAGLEPEWISSIAGTLTTLGYLPQALKTLRTRDTAALSVVMYTAMVIGVALWAFYGLLIGSLALMISNLVTLGLAGTILLMKLRCG